jgi:hypothetical protein
MSMKFHIAAASDIINKGLDLSYPHNNLGADGLLAQPFQEVAVDTVISSFETKKEQETVQPTMALTDALEEKHVEVAVDDKKVVKSSKGKAQKPNQD